MIKIINEIYPSQINLLFCMRGRARLLFWIFIKFAFEMNWLIHVRKIPPILQTHKGYNNKWSRQKIFVIAYFSINTKWFEGWNINESFTSRDKHWERKSTTGGHSSVINLVKASNNTDRYFLKYFTTSTPTMPIRSNRLLSVREYLKKNNR